MRISGINLPDEKRVDIGLSYLYGIGRKNVVEVLKKAEVEASKRIKTLTEDEQKRIQKVLETYKLEGDLRVEILNNIKRLKELGSYKGVRHGKNLPVRGQRTRSNARTKRGKRVTIGAIKKDLAVKMETSTAVKAKTGGK
ncbi:MAG TPA: 30S ribosomal protein S13 [Patescibacteria group bacterium]|nr:30S ribosomal protein S13 [Patescibacteria group bacterium]